MWLGLRMARYIPERTVDSLLASELIRHDPYTLIWSPSNTAGSADHLARGSSGVLAVFECKAVDRLAAGTWRSEVPQGQLDAHAARGHAVWYLFLGQPNGRDPANRRSCPSCRGWCRACCRDSRSWSLLAPHIKRADERLKLQPWFCHWSWVISAKNLRAAIPLRGPGMPSAYQLPVTDADMEALGKAERLCHFLAVPLNTRPDGPDLQQVNALQDAATFEDSTPPLVVLTSGTGPDISL